MVNIRFGIQNPFSKGIALAIGLSILAAVGLGQNYTQSLIPEANDGISISNNLAYWIIGEESWTQELFKTFFDWSIYMTLMLIIILPIVILLESKKNRKA
jgi:hypothetical protein